MALSLQSCPSDHTGIIQELGNNYYYMGDGRESQILLGRGDNRSGGKTIVAEEVTHYSYDSQYIIARNIQNRYNKEIKFWIIDKRQGAQPVPIDSIEFNVDSIEFNEELQKLNINLKLQPRK